MPSSARTRALELLRRDPLRHIVSLKMLARLGDQLELRLLEAEAGWALLLAFPSELIEYDAKTYGPGRSVAVLDGHFTGPFAGSLADELTARVASLPRREVIIKTHHPWLARRASEGLGAAPVTAFVSFTPLVGASPSAFAEARHAATPGVLSAPELSSELRAHFAQNGYDAGELERYFAAGARWFALRRDGEPGAACFVFQNFESVWEIAGVHTDARWRRLGLAARVVSAATRHLLDAGLRPRYQTEASNVASMQLARRVGLVEFLRIEHLVLRRGS